MTYKNLEIDFSNVHLACISGDNGAGKSSILDSITWCLLEKSRATNKDSLIRIGENEMYGEFIFSVEDNTYKIIRKTKKGNKTSQTNLEFQILSDNKYKTITGKGIKETQNRIIEVIKMDYDTLINSVFILQGKADEFTTKTPKERKEILSNILNLFTYDRLNEKAKEKKKEFDFQNKALENDINLLELNIENEKSILDELEELNSKKNNIENELKLNNNSITEKENTEKEILEKKLKLDNKEILLKKEYELLKNKEEDLKNIYNNINTNNTLLDDKENINEKYNELLYLRLMENKALENNKKFLELIKEKNNIENRIIKEKNNIENDLNIKKLKLEELQKKLKEINTLISEKDKTEKAFKKYEKAKEEDNIYQSKINKFHELSTNKDNLEKNKNKILMEYTKKISELETKINEIKKIISNENKIKNEILKLEEINKSINNLIVRRDYIKEEGEKINVKLSISEKENSTKKEEIKNLDLKIEIFQKENSHNCPMCNHSLNETDRNYLISKYYNEIELLQNEIDKLDLNISNLSKKRDIYRNDWNIISKEIKDKEKERETFVNKKKELENIENKKNELIDLENELNLLENKKNNDTSELNINISSIENYLKNLDFSKEKHSLIQAEIKNWSWSENKLNQINNSEKELISSNEKINELKLNIAYLDKKLLNEDYENIEINNLKKINNQIKELNYDENEYINIKNNIKKLENYNSLYQELQNANSKISELIKQKEKLSEEINNIKKSIDNYSIELKDYNLLEIELKEISKLLLSLREDYLKRQEDLKGTEIEIAIRSKELDEINSKKNILNNKKDEINKIKKEISIYDFLVKAFDKNGIPSLIIENIIPEIEADANYILSRITEGRMNIKFDTTKSNKTNDKVLETLEIYISDDLGTRVYEMYSGGEAFRINFAIRLALSKVLARRAGAKLKTLIIDEGFGTQDTKGISSLIEAINYISNDFDKILVVTHVNDLKEAFERRIEVYKTEHGSKVKLI